MTYEGISAQSLFLLAENRFQDSKAFYEENKAVIRSGVVEPLRRLVADLAPAMLKIDPLLVVDPMTNGCVSRVRRDNRFTHDKSMYRENMWIAFMRDKRAWEYCLPGFYMDVSLRGVSWGMGFYSAKPAVMQCLRQKIQEDPKRALQAVRKAQRAGFALEGEPYARPRSTPETPELLRPLFDCRCVDVSRREEPAFVADADLPKRLLAGFEALAPLYMLMMEATETEMGLREA